MSSIVSLCTNLSQGCIDTHTFIIQLKELLSQGHQVNETDEDGDIGLHKLVQLNSTYTEASRLLIQLGSDVNIKSKKNITPLYLAVSLYNVNMVRLLIAAGADPHMKINSNSSPYTLNTSMVKLIDDEIKWSSLGFSRNRITEYLDYDSKSKSKNEIVSDEIRKEQYILVKKSLFTICMAFQTLELPALLTLKIVDAMNDSYRQIPMLIKWNIIVLIKHAKKN